MAKSAKKVPGIYSVHPGVAMVTKWVSELKSKTGKTLEQWCRLIVDDGPESVPDRRTWLKDQYGLGTNTAWWLAERADGQPTWDESPEAYLAQAPVYIEDMYSGKKAALRPIHDALVALGFQIAGDLKICPCKTIVPFYRNHVIAEIKPATRTRIDFGLALGADVPFGKRLLDTGGLQKKNRITHKIGISSLGEIDSEVEHWLRTAYERDE